MLYVLLNAFLNYMKENKNKLQATKNRPQKEAELKM